MPLNHVLMHIGFRAPNHNCLWMFHHSPVNNSDSDLRAHAKESLHGRSVVGQIFSKGVTTH